MTQARFFELNTCYLKAHDLCMIHHAPDKVRHIDYMLSWGTQLGPLYPGDLEHARIFMVPEYGMGLGGLVSNTCGHLIVSTPIKDVINAQVEDPRQLEILRVAICDHKKRLVNDGYWYINPIGSLDCLDQIKSSIERDDDGEVISVEKKVLSLRGIDQKKPLFRIKESRDSYIIRHDLLMAIKDLNLPVPNIYAEELEVTGAAE
jgi:hypothetical protein